MRDLILIAIDDFIKKHGYSPTVREICKMVGRSPATVWHHIENLRDAGIITYTPGKNRTIVIKEK